MSSYLDREVERLSYFEKRPEAQERDWRLVEPEEKVWIRTPLLL